MQYKRVVNSTVTPDKMIAIFVILLVLKHVHSHGMMLQPPNRSSLWRFNKSAPVNYNDNQNFCGGAGVQWGKFKGKCGVCGDQYDDPVPQDNQNTGKYGRGVVVSEYSSGSGVEVHILLTANHIGYFRYSLCVLENPSLMESEDCFLTLNLTDSSDRYPVKRTDNLVNNVVKLPQNLTCDRCVLRWDYTTGNNWGFCNNGTAGLGCGPQETFRSCADIKIV